jgi:hypothetical protein
MEGMEAPVAAALKESRAMNAVRDLRFGRFYHFENIRTFECDKRDVGQP